MSDRVDDLRHDAARRRAVAGLQHAHGREGAHGAPARAAGRRRHRGRLPDRLRRRLRGGPGDLRGGQGRARSRRSAAARTRTSRRAARALERAAAPRDPHLPGHLGHPPQVEAQDHARGARCARPSRRSRWRARFAEEVEFSAEDASRTDYGFLNEVLQAVHRRPAPRTLNVPDTVGYALPAEYAEMVGRLVRDIPGAVISVHCHNDLGLAVANSLAAVRGGRAPDRVHDQRHRRARRQHLARGGRDGAQGAPRGAAGWRPASARELLVPTSTQLSTVTGVWPQPNKAIVGRNAFAHEAGIHQHGMLANPLCYEIMTPGERRPLAVDAGARQALRQARGRVAAQAARRQRSRRRRSKRSRARSRSWPTGPSSSTTRTCSRSSSTRPSRARSWYATRCWRATRSCPRRRSRWRWKATAAGLRGRQRPARRGAQGGRRGARLRAAAARDAHARGHRRQGRGRRGDGARGARRDRVARPGGEHGHDRGDAQGVPVCGGLRARGARGRLRRHDAGPPAHALRQDLGRAPRVGGDARRRRRSSTSTCTWSTR